MKPQLSLLFVIFVSTWLNAADPVEIGSRRELFVDDFLIDKLSGEAMLRLHRPTPQHMRQ